jgi:hypothetical protein
MLRLFQKINIFFLFEFKLVSNLINSPLDT